MKPSWVFAMALGAAIGWGAYTLPFDWMQKAGLAGTGAWKIAWTEDTMNNLIRSISTKMIETP